MQLMGNPAYKGGAVVFDLLSPVHIIVLLIVALLIFGPKKIPEMGSGLARGIREFRKAMNEVSSPDPITDDAKTNEVVLPPTSQD